MLIRITERIGKWINIMRKHNYTERVLAQVIKENNRTITDPAFERPEGCWDSKQEKAFLKSSLSVFRKGLLFNYAVERSEVGFENGFSLEKFAPFVHENNIVEIQDEVQSAYDNIERNGNSKIIFLDTSIKLTRLLHIKPSDANKKE